MQLFPIGLIFSIFPVFRYFFETSNILPAHTQTALDDRQFSIHFIEMFIYLHGLNKSGCLYMRSRRGVLFWHQVLPARFLAITGSRCRLKNEMCLAHVVHTGWMSHSSMRNCPAKIIPNSSLTESCDRILHGLGCIRFPN